MSALPVVTPPSLSPGSALAHILGGLPELAKGLLAAIAHCKPVPKDARNTHHGYGYAAADAIIEEGRAALLAGNCVLLPVSASLNGSERDGPDRFELVRVFVLMHSSGQSAPLQVTWPVVPGNGRPLDKATAAADTLSLAYLYRDLLAMNRVDPADDVAGREDLQPKMKPKPQPKPAAPPKPAPLPADGAELEQRLREFDRSMSQRGLSKAGECWDYVVNQAEAEGWSRDVVRWNDLTTIEAAIKLAKRFRDERLAQRQPAPAGKE